MHDMVSLSCAPWSNAPGVDGGLQVTLHDLGLYL
jgi:hypothetical protein